jgi:hypothetical protein
MKLSQIMQRAAQAYPDEYILRFYDEQRECAVPCEGAGDSLASFIAWELYETYDPEVGDDEQIKTAVDVIQNAANELQGVVRALRDLAAEREVAHG